VTLPHRGPQQTLQQTQALNENDHSIDKLWTESDGPKSDIKGLLSDHNKIGNDTTMAFAEVCKKLSEISLNMHKLVEFGNQVGKFTQQYNFSETAYDNFIGKVTRGGSHRGTGSGNTDKRKDDQAHGGRDGGRRPS
jgi:hypothetical protein